MEGKKEINKAKNGFQNIGRWIDLQQFFQNHFVFQISIFHNRIGIFPKQKKTKGGQGIMF